MTAGEQFRRLLIDDPMFRTVLMRTLTPTDYSRYVLLVLRQFDRSGDIRRVVATHDIYFLVTREGHVGVHEKTITLINEGKILPEEIIEYFQIGVKEIKKRFISALFGRRVQPQLKEHILLAPERQLKAIVAGMIFTLTVMNDDIEPVEKDFWVNLERLLPFQCLELINQLREGAWLPSLGPRDELWRLR